MVPQKTAQPHASSIPLTYKEPSLGTRIWKDLLRNRTIYLMLIPAILYYILFHYTPMYGAIIAFKKYNFAKGIFGSAWVGFKHFESFFSSYYFERLVRNTLLINIFDIAYGFPLPIILALLLNEVQKQWFKRTVQTITYLPHFISTVVICGMLLEFSSFEGLFNDIIAMFGGTRTSFFIQPQYFRTFYIASGIWQQVGWSSIIYLASMSNIDPQLYEAATIDGANRFRQVLHVTIPGITAIIVMQLILRCGHMMSVGADKVLLLYNSNIYETADVISTFVYRKGLLEANYSYATAVGLFNSVINFAVLITVNQVCKKVTDNSLF